MVLHEPDIRQAFSLSQICLPCVVTFPLAFVRAAAAALPGEVIRPPPQHSLLVSAKDISGLRLSFLAHRQHMCAPRQA